MSDVVRRLMRFLGLIEEEYTDYGTTPARTYADAPADEWNRAPAPSPAPMMRPQPVRPAPVNRVSSISILDANGEPIRARAVPPLGGPRGMSTVTSELDVEIFKPASFNEADRVTNQLKLARPVILNIVYADAGLRRRYIDFTSGVVCAMDATIESLEKGLVYLVCPKGVTVAPEVKSRLRANRYEAR
jgi:FtsZ-interacting cell division protein YlmF